MENGARQRLDSWKSIAQHLGRNERTVARWEKERGLPIHRVPGGRARRTVFAFAHELDEWLVSHPDALSEDDNQLGDASAPPRPRARDWRTVTVVLTALAIPVGVWAVWEARFAPLDLWLVRVQDRAIVGETRAGTVAWTFTPPLPFAEPPGNRWSALGNLDSAPGAEAVLAPMGPFEGPDPLYAVSNRGDLLWQRTLDGSVTFGQTRYGPPWRSLAVVTFETGGAARIAWATHHQTWWPAVVAVLDTGGRVLHRFVHAGWISSVRVTSDGRHLLAAGTANPYHGYALAVLDARHPGGSSPPPLDTNYTCRDCPPGAPRRYFVLGRSELARVADVPLFHEFAPPLIVLLPSGDFEVHAVQSPGTGNAEAIFEFSSDFRLQRSRVSDTYWTWHRELERTGKITHSADQCPDRRGLSVREWSPDHGWREVAIR